MVYDRLYLSKPKYLKYKNRRGDFVDALMNIINWDNVAQRYDIALKLK